MISAAGTLQLPQWWRQMFLRSQGGLREQRNRHHKNGNNSWLGGRRSRKSTLSPTAQWFSEPHGHQLCPSNNVNWDQEPRTTLLLLKLSDKGNEGFWLIRYWLHNSSWNMLTVLTEGWYSAGRATLSNFSTECHESFGKIGLQLNSNKTIMKGFI